MKIEFWVIGKTAFKYLDTGIQDYSKRLKQLTDFQMVVLPDAKTKDTSSLMKKEAQIVLNKLRSEDILILLDENGKMFSSKQFAEDVEKRQYLLQKKIIFLVGGAYGFDKILYDRANDQLSLSEMTFSHQLVRIIFLEQLYRAFTIIKGLPYHHE